MTSSTGAELPMWGTQRVDEMTDDEKIAAILADAPRYMAQARAEEMPRARAWVEQRIVRKQAERRATALSKPWWTWPAAWMRGDL